MLMDDNFVLKKFTYVSWRERGGLIMPVPLNTSAVTCVHVN